MKKIRFAAMLALILLTAPGQAQAYVDPGAGSILLQALLGGVAASLAVGTAYWRKLRNFFSRSERAEPTKKG